MGVTEDAMGEWRDRASGWAWDTLHRIDDTRIGSRVFDAVDRACDRFEGSKALDRIVEGFADSQTTEPLPRARIGHQSWRDEIDPLTATNGNYFYVGHELTESQRREHSAEGWRELMM